MQAAGLATVRWVLRPVHDLSVVPARADGPGAQHATEWLCAERPGQPPLPLMALRAAARQSWAVHGAADRLAQDVLPPMRPASVLVALALALGSIAWAPLAALAVAYAGWRGSRRALLRHRTLCEIDGALRRTLTDTLPAPDYNSVRSLQISGNSTTSSILRR